MVEVLVAVAMLGVAFAAIIGLQTQATRQHRVQQEWRERLTLERSAIAVLRSVNPMAEPAGGRSLSPTTMLRWIAIPLTQPVRSIAPDGTDGSFDVALYAIDATVVSPGKQALVVRIEQVGWRSRVSAS